jgi:hypothetical protein
LFLVKHGVPLDVAFSLDPAERLAWVIVMGEFEGLRWDYEARGWR